MTEDLPEGQVAPKEDQEKKPEYFVSANTGKRTPRLDGKKDKEGNWESHDDIVKRCQEMGFDNIADCPHSQEINEATGMPWLKAMGYDSKKSKKNRKTQTKRKAKKAQAKEASEAAVPTVDSEVTPPAEEEPDEVANPDEPTVKDVEEAEAMDAEPTQDEKIEVEPDAEATYSALKMPELRKKCSERNLPSSGNKKQLINLLVKDDEKSASKD